jgi:hypothetical protein
MSVCVEVGHGQKVLRRRYIRPRGVRTSEKIKPVYESVVKRDIWGRSIEALDGETESFFRTNSTGSPSVFKQKGVQSHVLFSEIHSC